ncbi:hypothetical protein [Staphylococcus arlettae]|uniref:hypothetical protein n=1 Tax=Staphylococcus arlettae TaxID=29378 RepID=UPI000DCE40DB|nr:hypothetical protein [Staphylococcus arlettae]RBA02383.1 hypothetical protein DOD22_2173 [Staphylococcus arlettae]
MVNLKEEHERYRKQFKKEKYRKKIREHDRAFRKKVEDTPIRDATDKKVKYILENLLDIFSNKDFYFSVYQFPNSSSSSYLFHTKDFEAMFHIRFTGKSNVVFLKELLKEYPILIEVEALHSFKKGMGKNIVELLINASNIIKTPIYIFDNNLKDENYYQRLGFIETESTGSNNEPLLVYKP